MLEADLHAGRWCTTVRSLTHTGSPGGLRGSRPDHTSGPADSSPPGVPALAPPGGKLPVLPASSDVKVTTGA